jgi:hypothetical protein
VFRSHFLSFFHLGGDGCIGHCHDSISLDFPHLIDDRILAFAMTDLLRLISFVLYADFDCLRMLDYLANTFPRSRRWIIGVWSVEMSVAMW